MLFCSQKFAFFFLLLLAVYWAMPWARARVYLLLGASFYFYACWNKWLAVLICVSSTVDFLLARGIAASDSPRWRKVLLTLNVAGNLGLLCYFKYANFFLHSLEQALSAAGYSAAWSPLKVILPVGISFYTFEAISYVVDVYRGRVKAETNLSHFMLFILFFPHLVAGPIVRGRDFLPQVRRRKHWSWLRAQIGVQLFVMGLFKKLVIGDRMAQFADPVFADPSAFSTGAAWVAILAYALQVYGDFSGYSDMALGCAHLLGYHLTLNFDMPYVSLNIAEFWRRWHMTLGSWLRDYIYYPLGGSRGTFWLVARNLMITMTLCGLWHGADWNYFAYGALQGVLLLVHRLFRASVARAPRMDGALKTRPGIALRWAVTMLTVWMGYVVFRGTSFQTTGEFLTRLVVPCAGLASPLPVIGLWLTILVVVIAHALAVSGLWREWLVRLPAPVLGAGCTAAMLLALMLTPTMSKAFIYFQF